MTSAAVTQEFAAASCIDLLCFDVGAERFAVPLAQVDSIVDACEVQVVRSGAQQRAVMRVHGELVAVHEAWNVLQVRRQHAEPVALLLDARGVMIALLVDGADTALQIPLEGLRTPPRIMRSDRIVEGMLYVHSRWVALLSPSALADALNTSLNTNLITSTHEPSPVAAHGI